MERKTEVVAFKGVGKSICYKQDYLPWQKEDKRYIYFVDTYSDDLTKGEWFICNNGIYQYIGRELDWINSEYISSHDNIKNGNKGLTTISHNEKNCKRIVSTNNPNIDKPRLFEEYIKELVKYYNLKP